MLIQRADERRGRRGSANEHVAKRRQVVGSLTRLERLKNRHPDRRHAAGDGDALPLEQFQDADWIQMRARHHELGADHGARIGQPPAIRVEHRHGGQHGVALTDAERVGKADGERMQRDRSVRVEDSFGLAGRACRVAHRGGGALVEIREVGGRLGVRDRRFVIDRVLDGPVVSDDDHGLELHVGSNAFKQRNERGVHDEDTILRVIDDVREVVRMEPQVECMEHGAREWHGEVGFEVVGVRPRERCDAVAPLHAEILQHADQTPRPVGKIAEPIARDGLVRPPRDHFLGAEKCFGAPKHRRDGEREVHHLTVHAANPTSKTRYSFAWRRG